MDGAVAASLSKNGSINCGDALLLNRASVHTSSLLVVSARRQQTCLSQDIQEIPAARDCDSIEVRIFTAWPGSALLHSSASLSAAVRWRSCAVRQSSGSRDGNNTSAMGSV